jgi:hypothetical protein
MSKKLQKPLEGWGGGTTGMLRFRQTGPGLESSVLTRKESSIGTLLTAAKPGPHWSLVHWESEESVLISNQTGGNKEHSGIKYGSEKEFNSVSGRC